MNRKPFEALAWWLTFLILSMAINTSNLVAAAPDPPAAEQACLKLAELPNLTILSAKLVEAKGGTPQYCYVRGLISPAIHYHVQLPLPESWNGRFLMWGDGGQDGDLDFADHRVAQGYAVANSNMGHDNGSEPGSSYAFNNRQAELDFGYRAVHLTVNAAKTLVSAYYGKKAQRSYFEGCSQGGREGLIEAQRFPADFDGIVAGDPVNFTVELTASRVWMLERLFRDGFSANLAYDTDRNGSQDSVKKVELLTEAVMAKCDARDGVRDGVLEDPLSCPFDPKVDLASKMCSGNFNADACFTTAQLQSIQDIYDGARDSKGVRILKGLAKGSEGGWSTDLIPYAGNSFFPDGLQRSGDRINYMFYETDPGVPPANLSDLSRRLDKKKIPPEYGWWEFNIDDLTAGKLNLMISILDAKDPDLTHFLKDNGGKFILYHGWADRQVPPEPTLDYFKEVVTNTFKGDLNVARQRMRLFMAPGMDHCSGGPGPDTWDRLAPLVNWVETGQAPDFVVATHRTDGKVDNERKICAYPQKGVYTGPAGGANDRASWVQANFTCR